MSATNGRPAVHQGLEARIIKNETKIYGGATEQTTAELRDLQLAKQYLPAAKKGDLYSMAADAIKKHFRQVRSSTWPALLLDAHRHPGGRHHPWSRGPRWRE
jgi:hypothetical protein